MKKGQPFNAYRMFTWLFIPEGLARSSRISPGAKLAWGRLGGCSEPLPLHRRGKPVIFLVERAALTNRQARTKIREIAEQRWKAQQTSSCGSSFRLRAR